ncbi:MAG: DUF6624 domain-containing protein [Bacteroidota bacterium]
MRYLILPFILLLCSKVGICQLRHVFGQPFDSLYQQAEYHSEAENHALAAAYYQRAWLAYGEGFPDLPMYWYAFETFYHGQQLENGLPFFRYFVDRVYISDEKLAVFRKDTVWARLRSHSAWPTLLAQIQAQRPTYRTTLQQLDTLDVDGPQALAQVETIVAEYGWLGRYKIGEAADVLTKVIKRADTATRERYLPLIRESVECGEESRAAFAFLQDQLCIDQHKAQIYGTQVTKNKEGLYELHPIYAPKYVDLRRASIGFEPLREYAGFFDINLKD